MEELFYWIIEYIKVLLGYGFIMFVWPSAVFRKYLKGKSATFRFGFCATVPIVIINTVVLMLGLLHILNKWTMWIFFYGLLIWSFREKFRITENAKKKFKYLITGTFGWKHLLLLIWEGIVRVAKKCFRVFWKFYKVHWLEYTLLVAAVVYGVNYFSWGVWHEHSYVFSDVYTHHSWIYQLTQGKPFSAGIYPEGMHCVVYGLYALFNIRIYTILLFLPSVNMALILVAIYCFVRELFQWRYSAIFTLFIFLTVALTNRIFMISMARAQCALPQEFAFPAIFLCALFLLRYLKSKKTEISDERFNKWCINDNLLIFVMALATTIAVHFYATIMAFYLCVAIAIVCWRKIFRKTHFLPLVVAAISGLLIAATPM
ncbi:MAG: hypothetical protein IJ274_16130, partial [Lachnospiraceae bacterium]|nr:hypothetical protein [Lachnospiraceae bacterium]